MKSENVKSTGAESAPDGGMLVIEQFLNENYLFRRNQLNGKVEFITKSSIGETVADSDQRWRALTDLALNSIVIRAMREGLDEECNPKSEIQLLVQSEEVRAYDPIADYLSQLPQWDGQNHVAQLFSRLPGLSSEHLSFLTIWIRSAVAHWLQMDTLHGNECVPTLIGAQGCGKTTFFNRLLPQHLRQYYLDHLNLSNKFDKEMALTNNLLVNLDELDAIRPSQQSALKQTLSKSKVNGRPIYGASQEDRPRYASFVATTNNPHPLKDETGSRRYICMTIPNGLFIDNTGEIDYDQLYAQIVYELRELKSPYWFNNDEVARIQQLNLEYMEKKDIGEIVEILFRKPEENEAGTAMNSTQMLAIIRNKYPSVPCTMKSKIAIGKALRSMNYSSTDRSGISYYKVVLQKAA